MLIPYTTMTTPNIFARIAILFLLLVSSDAIGAASSGEAARMACPKCEATLSVPAPAKDMNSSGGGGGVIRTIRMALKPDREGISHASMAVPLTTAGLLAPPAPPPPPVMSYATMAS